MFFNYFLRCPCFCLPDKNLMSVFFVSFEFFFGSSFFFEIKKWGRKKKRTKNSLFKFLFEIKRLKPFLSFSLSTVFQFKEVYLFVLFLLDLFSLFFLFFYLFFYSDIDRDDTDWENDFLVEKYWHHIWQDKVSLSFIVSSETVNKKKWNKRKKETKETEPGTKKRNTGRISGRNRQTKEMKRKERTWKQIWQDRVFISFIVPETIKEIKL